MPKWVLQPFMQWIETHEAQAAQIGASTSSGCQVRAAIGLENTVKLAVVAPLLDLSGLFLPPFYLSTEDSVEIEVPDKI